MFYKYDNSYNLINLSVYPELHSLILVIAWIPWIVLHGNPLYFWSLSEIKHMLKIHACIHVHDCQVGRLTLKAILNRILSYESFVSNPLTTTYISNKQNLKNTTYLVFRPIINKPSWNKT